MDYGFDAIKIPPRLIHPSFKMPKRKNNRLWYGIPKMVWFIIIGICLYLFYQYRAKIKEEKEKELVEHKKIQEEIIMINEEERRLIEEQNSKQVNFLPYNITGQSTWV
jgi:hypothetical protein